MSNRFSFQSNLSSSQTLASNQVSSSFSWSLERILQCLALAAVRSEFTDLLKKKKKANFVDFGFVDLLDLLF